MKQQNAIRKCQYWLLLLVFIGLIASCKSEPEYRKIDSGDKANTSAESTSTDGKAKGSIEDMGDADSAADASVSAELGGNGFAAIADSTGWETSGDFGVLGSPDAKKGGDITMAWPEMPATLRYIGKDANLTINWIVSSLVYESLLSSNPKTQEFVPALATHWKASEDKMTYWFRLDPRAKWADGKPVTADDIIESWKIRIDPGIQAPSTNGTYSENYDKPEKESKYIVKVKLKKKNWRSILYFSGMPIFPAHHLTRLDGGAGFLKKYQWEMIPGTGAYEMNIEASKKGEQVVLKRRTDYWGSNLKRNEGLFNFDEIKFIAILDDKLRFEKFKKGDFDLYQISRAQWWAEELTAEKLEEVKRGLIQKKKIFNFEASGLSGLAFNIREEPFNDIKTREAFQYLWNIPELNEKLFYNEYAQCTSYFEGTMFTYPNNEVPAYNPDKALGLLKEVGWVKKEGEKWLSKDGKIFEIDLNITQGMDRIFTPFQQDLEKTGIKLNLNIVTGQARFNKLLERQFKIAFANWGGLNIPNPETSMHSKYADPAQTNNITGMKDPKIDEICKRYDESYDAAERQKMLQEIDKLAVEGRYYAMGWIAPYNFRCAYWNKFDHPEWGFPYSSDLNYEYALMSWWYDADKAKKLDEAKKDNSITLPTTEVEVDYWGRKK